MPVLTIPRLGAAAAALALGATAIPTPALADVGYTVPAGVSVVQIVADGGRGGNNEVYEGGVGCRVTTSLAVAEGDVFTWTVGGNGGDVVNAQTAQSGGAGGTGPYAGGDGGGTPGVGTPGAGGGAATNVLLDGTEIIVAGGGGGAAMTTGGGSGCAWYGPAGGDGWGSWDTRAIGGSDPTIGGTGAATQYAIPGSNGNAATGSPAGRGGDGANAGSSGASAGPGGGGGVSGGGGGDAQTAAYTPGGLGSAAAGLSMAPVAPTGVAATQFSPNPGVEGDYSGGVAINVVTIDLDIPAATQGAPYAGSVSGMFAGTEEVTGYIALYTVSPSLPAGLTLDPATGSITGTPTTVTSSTDYTVTVRRIVSIETPPPSPDVETYDPDDASKADIIAESSATFSLRVAGSLPETGPSRLLGQLPVPAVMLMTAGAALVALGATRRSPRSLR